MVTENTEPLKRKVALVTGGAQGIGAALCLALAKDGFDIAVVDLPFQRQEAALVIEAIQQTVPKAKAIFIGCDVSKRDEVFEAVELTYTTFGYFDVMVNNAGIALIKGILEVTEADSLKTWKVNFNGVLWGIQAAAQKFIELKHPRGKIINACSIAAYRESVALSMYGSSKFAVRGLTQTAAKELARYKITVNNYCPGIVNTPMWEAIDTKISELTNVPKGNPTEVQLNNIALGRLEEPEDLGGIVSFLASEKSDYITGQSIIVDGGMIFS